MPMAQQVAVLYALTNGFIDDVDVEKVKVWENDFQKYMKSGGKEVLEMIAERKELTDEVVKSLEKAINEFKNVYQNGK